MAFNGITHAAENDIQTAKRLIIANIIGYNESFPFQEWHRLLLQIKLTLNIIRPTNVRSTTVSANKMYIHGIHDYNQIPLGTQCYLDSKQQTSYGSHLWYLGTFAEHLIIVVLMSFY